MDRRGGGGGDKQTNKQTNKQTKHLWLLRLAGICPARHYRRASDHTRLVAPDLRYVNIARLKAF